MPRSDGCRRIRASQISRAVNCLRFLNIRPPLRAFYFLYIPFPLPPQMCPLSPVVIHLSVSLQPTPRLFLLPYCPPLQPVPVCSHLPTAPFARSPSIPILFCLPLAHSPLAAARLPRTSSPPPKNTPLSLQKNSLPNGTTSPKTPDTFILPPTFAKNKNCY